MSCSFCSDDFLLYMFYGIAFSMLSPHPVLLPVFIFAVLTAAVALLPVSGILEVMLFSLIGVAYGYGLRWQASADRVVPDNVHKRHRLLFLHIAELVVAPFLFWDIDSTLPGGYPAGLAMSFVFYNGYFILVYNINYRHEQTRLKISDQFSWTYFLWYASLLPFYAGALSPLDSNILRALVGGAFAVAMVFSLAVFRNRFI